MKTARIYLLQQDNLEVDVYLNGQIQKRENTDSGYEIARLVGDQPCTIALVDTAEQVAEFEKAAAGQDDTTRFELQRLAELDDLIESVCGDGDLRDSDQFAPQWTNGIVLAKVLKSYEVMRKAIRQALKDNKHNMVLLQADAQVDELMGCDGD